MATTYKDFYIYYNGTYYDGSVDNGLTAINCYYNGTYFGEGARTIPTAGYYCDYNFSIGNKSISSAGKYCDYNFQVTTQNRYRWYKYTLRTYYIPGTYTITKPSGMSAYYIWGDTEDKRALWTSASSYSYDRYNATFTLSGGFSTLIRISASLVYPYIGGITTSTTASNVVSDFIYERGANSNISIVQTHGAALVSSINLSYEATATMMHTASSSQEAGTLVSTDITSTNYYAYPTNGAQDGYWYVMV